MAEQDHKEAQEVQRIAAGPLTAGLGADAKVVTLHQDTEHDGMAFKAGTQELSASVADALIEAGKAFEPGGKVKGR